MTPQPHALIIGAGIGGMTVHDDVRWQRLLGDQLLLSEHNRRLVIGCGASGDHRRANARGRGSRESG
jgi:hypothetical protein